MKLLYRLLAAWAARVVHAGTAGLVLSLGGAVLFAVLALAQGWILVAVMAPVAVVVDMRLALAVHAACGCPCLGEGRAR